MNRRGGPVADTGKEDVERRELARGSALSFVGSVTSALLGFVLTIVITRLLGADGAGIVFQATGVFAVVMAFAKFGMDSTSVYLLPRLLIDEPRQVRGAINACLAIAVGFGLVLVAIVELLASWLWGDQREGLLHSVQAIVLFVPFGAVFLILSASLRALGSVVEYVLVSNIAVPVLRPPLVAIAAVAVGSAVAVSVAWAVPLAMMALVAGLLILRRLRVIEAGVPGPIFPGRARWVEIWKFSVPRTIAAGLEQAIVWVDILLVGWLASDYAAGIYGGATRFVQAGLLVDAALRVIVSPRFSALLHQGASKQVQTLYVTASSWLVLLGTPAYVLLAFSPQVFLQLLGDEFTQGSVALSILAVGMAITFLAGNIHSLLIMSGRSGWAATNKFIVLIVNVTGNLLLIPHFGIEGAAITWAFCMVLDAALASIQVRIFLRITPSLIDVFRPLVIVVISFGVPALLVRLLVGNSLAGMLFTVLAGGILYCAACWWWRKSLRISGLTSMVSKRK